MVPSWSARVGDLCRKKGGSEEEKAERERMVLEAGQQEEAAYEAVQRLRKEGFRKVSSLCRNKEHLMHLCGRARVRSALP